MKQAGTLDSPDLALAVALLLEVPALSSLLFFAGWSILCVPFQNLIGHYIAYSSHIVREAKSMLDHISNCVKAKGECEIGDGLEDTLLLLLLLLLATTNGNGHAPLSGPSC